MIRSVDLRARWAGLCLALLCLASWLGTPWHLALEPHDHDFVRVATEHDHDHDHHHDDDHERPDGHDADDHLISAASRPHAGVVELLTLVPPTALLACESRATPPAPAPPRDDVEPSTDPPPAPRQPRAPPVG